MASFPTSDSQNSTTLEYSLQSPDNVVLLLDESDEESGGLGNELFQNETDRGATVNTNQASNPFLDFLHETQVDDEQRTLSYSFSPPNHTADDSDRDSNSVPSSPLHAVDIPYTSNNSAICCSPPEKIVRNNSNVLNSSNCGYGKLRLENSNTNIDTSKGNSTDIDRVSTEGADDETDPLVQPKLEQSISYDAAQLAAIFENVDTELIHIKLKAVRSLPNRIDIVTNQLLEEQEQSGCHGNSTTNDVAENHANINYQFDSVFADVEKVIDMLTTHGLSNLPDRNVVFEVLEHVGDQDTRIQMTVDHFVNSGNLKEGLMDVDPFEPLERSEVNDGLHIPQGVHDHQEIQTEPNSEHTELLAFTAHPLFEDLRVVAKVFPYRDPNEIMAYLEAHHDKPHRVPLVIDELLNLDNVGDSLNANDDEARKRTLSGTDDVEFVGIVAKKRKVSDESTDKKDGACIVVDDDDDGEEMRNLEKANSPTNIADASASSTSHLIDPIVAKLEEDFETLKSLIPDADPNYIFHALESMVGNDNRVHDIANAMLEKHDYPKLKDVLQEQQKIARKQKIMDGKFEMEEFLRLFDDPVQYFYNEEKKMSENYIKHSLVKLMNEFPMLTQDYITTVLKKRNSHFLPAMRELERDQQLEFMKQCEYQRRGAKYKGFHNRKKYRLKARTAMEPWPEDLDEMFFKELLFMQHEPLITEKLEEKKQAHQARVERARTRRELQVCVCCYEDELLFDEMVACEDGHLFCKECVRRSSEEVIGRSRVEFPCLAPDCKCHFSVSVLQKVLLPSVFSNLLKRIQEEEIRKADIPNLETCPFCSFATIMDNPEDKVFKCLNTDCLKESCRLCKELNHVPLRCEEVEKENETKKRTFIENQMTEAMLRTCWKCKKKFFKEDGCNKMTCECGASMCYICRQPIKGYEHFGTAPGQCPPTLNIDHRTYHLNEVATAGVKAKEVYSKDNPEGDVDLKYDPLKDVQNNLQTAPNHGIPFPNPYAPGAFINFQVPPIPPIPPVPPMPPPHLHHPMFQMPAFGAGGAQQMAFNAPGIQVAAQGFNFGLQGGPPPGPWNPFHGQNPEGFNPDMGNRRRRQRRR